MNRWNYPCFLSKGGVVMATSSILNPPIKITAENIDSFIAAFNSDKDFMEERPFEYKEGNPEELRPYFDNLKIK